MTGGKPAVLQAHCRYGVWTTLERRRAREFVTRVAWGRLGRRPPRRLLRIRDQLMEGIRARLMPEPDGSVRFRIEVATADAWKSRTVGFYEGRRVTLGAPMRHGYRFEGRAPAGYSGLVAAWGPRLRIHLDVVREPALEPAGLIFRAGDEEGVVVGDAVMAEAFEERWEPAKPIHVAADGVERTDYHLVRRRHAAGFRYPLGSRPLTYGSRFSFSRHG